MNPKTTDAKLLPKSAFPGPPYPPGSLARRSHPKACWHGWRVFLDVPDTSNVFARTLGAESLFKANLAGASFKGTSLGGANLNFANLEGLDLRGQILNGSTLQKARLRLADPSGTQIIGTNLTGADLSESNLAGTRLDALNLDGCNLRSACLACTILKGSALIGADLRDADLSGSFIYGVSEWDLLINDGTKQQDLVVTPDGKPVVTVDNIKVAQFIYLLLDNKEIRDVIDTSKAVLILGRFCDERKQVLSALREELRRLGYLPIMFDFDCPDSKDITETVMTLAGLSAFVIADITSPRSTPLELQVTIPDCMTPFVPILQENEEPFSMFVDLQRKYDWVLDVLKYDSPANLIAKLKRAVIDPALEMRREMTLRKAKPLTTRHISDYD